MDTEPVAKVVEVKNKNIAYLTIWCERCNTTHSVVVRPPSKTASLDVTSPVFKWNGSTTLPTLDNGRVCLLVGSCHIFIRKGKIHYFNDENFYGLNSPKTKWEPLLPVKDWPKK